jgi:hypothetical protein
MSMTARNVVVIALVFRSISAGANAQTGSETSRCHSSCSVGFTRCNQISKMNASAHQNCAEKCYWCTKGCPARIRSAGSLKKQHPLNDEFCSRDTSARSPIVQKCLRDAAFYPRLRFPRLIIAPEESIGPSLALS